MQVIFSEPVKKMHRSQIINMRDSQNGTEYNFQQSITEWTTLPAQILATLDAKTNTKKLKEHTCGLCSVRLVQGRIDSTQWFIVVWQNKTLTTTQKKIKGARGKWLVIEMWQQKCVPSLVWDNQTLIQTITMAITEDNTKKAKKTSTITTTPSTIQLTQTVSPSSVTQIPVNSQIVTQRFVVGDEHSFIHDNCIGTSSFVGT